MDWEVELSVLCIEITQKVEDPNVLVSTVKRQRGHAMLH